MKYPILFLFCFNLSQLFAGPAADSTRALQVGDSVILGECPQNAKFYKYIQSYKKTRFPNPGATYNKQTGEDFYEYFFLDGDYDVKFLTCDYALKKYKVVSLRVFVDKNTGADRNVMFLDLGQNTVAWVELEGAAAAMEVYVE
jgi:hypothetical protein